ncbi:MAG: hypothetical protein IPL50_12530 [Chitinophagaceae bacterium]|nr:hypothetical protein [Chitinophagaceae bacterium]
MRSIFILAFVLSNIVSFAQNSTTETFKNDSLIIVTKNPKKGFYHDYILFIPKKTVLHKKIFLLVEPNNTGKITDSIEVHKKYAVDLASVSSVGNNISTELKIPLLVPIFPEAGISTAYVYPRFGQGCSAGKINRTKTASICNYWKW